jgi:hypothetical protein
MMIVYKYTTIIDVLPHPQAVKVAKAVKAVKTSAMPNGTSVQNGVTPFHVRLEKRTMVTNFGGGRKRLIEISRFQPFASRQGIDTVYRLRFQYDPDIILILKAALHRARGTLGGNNLGGWLEEHRCWFVEPSAWPLVADQLRRNGCQLQSEPCRELAPLPPPAPPKPPSCPDCCGTAAQLERWRWEMKQRWSDDAAPVIEGGYELLRELLLGVSCQPSSGSTDRAERRPDPLPPTGGFAQDARRGALVPDAVARHARFR